MINKKTIGGVSLAAVFAFAMMANPVFAVSPNLQIESADGYSMTVKGAAPGHGVDDHTIIAYAFITDAPGPVDNTFIAEVAAVHPDFVDDSEQVPVKPIIHAHELYLDNDTLCIKGLDVAATPEVTVDGSTISVPQSNGGNVIAHAIAAYDITDDGICPTEIYSIQPVE